MRELFRDGDWALEQGEDIGRPGQIWGFDLNPTNIVFTHRCYGEELRLTYDITKNLRCGRCGEDVPEALVGLKAMVDWDK